MKKAPEVLMLERILKHGNTYQRGVAKGVLRELTAEVDYKLKEKTELKVSAL